jgi:hypothetical protein
MSKFFLDRPQINDAADDRNQFHISNIFSNKSKPITYLKGDNVCLAEISEETFLTKCGNYTYYQINSVTSVDNKKYSSDTCSHNTLIARHGKSLNNLDIDDIKIHSDGIKKKYISQDTDVTAGFYSISKVWNENYNTVSVSQFGNNISPECIFI